MIMEKKNVPLAGGTNNLNTLDKNSEKALENQVKTKYNIDSFADFAEMDFPPRKWLMYPFIQEKSLCMLCAKRGIGKTYFALTSAVAISTGTGFSKFRVDRDAKVFYIDGEMAASDIKGRVIKIAAGLKVSIPKENLFILTPDRQDCPMPNLLDPKAQLEIDAFLETNPVDLVIIDNLSMLCNGIRENDAESWAPMQKWLLSLRHRNIAVLIVDHAGKNTEGARGTSKKQDALDSVITLKKPEGYRPSEGARFEVHFEKTRGICGGDIEPFEVRLSEDDDGYLEWITSGVCSLKTENKTAQIKQAGDLSAQGKSVRQISEIMGFGKSKAAELVKESKLSDISYYINDADERTDDIPY